jgi:hypothetical protein
MATETEIAPSQQTIEAQRRMFEQQWEVQQKQALQDAANLSKQEAEVLRVSRDNTKKGNVIGASVAAVGAGAATKLAIDKARDLHNPDALAKQAGTFVADQAGKGNGMFGWGKFDPAKAAEKAAKKFGKDSEITQQVTSKLNSLANLTPETAKAAAADLKTGADFSQAASSDIAGKGVNWVSTGFQKGRELIGGAIPPKARGWVIGGTVVLGAVGGKIAYDKLHEGNKQQAAMLNEQIAAKEAEASKYANAIETTKWQDYVRQREATAQGVGQTQLG